jgi:hypothetical protein
MIGLMIGRQSCYAGRSCQSVLSTVVHRLRTAAGHSKALLGSWAYTLPHHSCYCCHCLQPNVGRYTTGIWTRAYLEQQLQLMLAGRAAEELVFGRDELSSLHQAKLMLAREVRVQAAPTGFLKTRSTDAPGVSHSS